MLLTREERAYLAGLFDGEGCVSIMTQSNGVPIARVSISQKDPEVLHWVTDKVGFGRVYESPKTTANWAVQRAEDVKTFAALVYPFSIVKADQLRVGYALADAVPTRSEARSATKEERHTNDQRRLALAGQLSEMK